MLHHNYDESQLILLLCFSYIYLIVMLLRCVESVAFMFYAYGGNILSFWCISHDSNVGYVVALTF